MHVNTLIVTGSETDVCVLASVLAAVDLGYRAAVVKDGLRSSSDEAHDSTLNLFMRCFDLQIELADAAKVLETWRL
jgi:nicotinamidase-related amidase